MTRRTIFIAIICASMSVMLATGIRQSFGLFLSPVSEQLGTGREAFSLAIALSNIIYGLPLVGFLADWVGSRWILAAGGLLYAVGLLLLTGVTSALGLNMTLGLLVGIALSATTYVVVLGAVGQLVTPQQRSRVFGFITATGSSGMFVIPPVAQFLIERVGWQSTLMVLAGASLIIVLLALGLPRRRRSDADAAAPKPETPNPATPAPGADSPDSLPLGVLARQAWSHSGYLLLIAGFFVCGFHVAFIATHLPAFLGDWGISPYVGAAALSLVGGFNIIGSFTFGWLGDLYRKKYLLSLIYLGRAIVISLFLIFPITAQSALIFAGAMGFLWLATVPLTSGTVAQIFGTRYLSTFYGMVFLSHQVGAFLGVWLGGRVYDATGSYGPIWIASIALGIFGALIHLPLSDHPVVLPKAPASEPAAV